MSYTLRPPFSPLCDFVMVRPRTIMGVAYGIGDKLPDDVRTAVGEASIKRWYNARTIAPADPVPPARKQPKK